MGAVYLLPGEEPKPPILSDVFEGFTIESDDTGTDGTGAVSGSGVRSGVRRHYRFYCLDFPTIHTYDALNQLLWRFDPLNGTTGFTYDANGNLLSVTDARSNATSYAYDNMDRLATRVDLLTRSESYQYDLAGDMRQLMDRKSKVTKVWAADKYLAGCRC